MYGMFTNMFQKNQLNVAEYTGHMDPMGIWNGISVNLHTNINILTFAFHPGDITYYIRYNSCLKNHGYQSGIIHMHKKR